MLPPPKYLYLLSNPLHHRCAIQNQLLPNWWSASLSLVVKKRIFLPEDISCTNWEANFPVWISFQKPRRYCHLTYWSITLGPET